MKHILLAISFCTCALFSSAQGYIDTDSISNLNTLRIETNKKGMSVLTAWGGVNTISGAIGYFTANKEEWKAFHGMNAIWGITNAGIGISGLFGARKEMTKQLSCANMLGRYEQNKRLFLINGGLDFLYIGTGVYLMERSKTEKNPAVWNGFGRSIALQGVFLLLFDGAMYISHQSKNKQWYKLLNGVCITGNGVGFNYTF